MRLLVVANPGSGQPEPVLSILNDAFGPAEIDWDVAVTHGPGDGHEATLRGVDEGYDLICAYGGDGTVTEVASALARGGPPMGVLPGGTGNGLAGDLGIPDALADAAALIAGHDYEVCKVDMGRLGDGWFILRATMGFEADVVQAATRELKDRFGWMAYAFAGLQTMAAPPMATYRIEVDGQSVEASGLACIVANSASTGVMGLRIADDVSVSDGVLDVIVVDSQSLPSLAGNLADAAAGQQPRSMTRWRGKHIKVESEPSQSVLLDGEDAGKTPIDIDIVAGAIGVAVPKKSAPSK